MYTYKKEMQDVVDAMPLNVRTDLVILAARCAARYEVSEGCVHVRRHFVVCSKPASAKARGLHMRGR